MRSSITRRTARNSSAAHAATHHKQESSPEVSAAPQQQQQPTTIASSTDPHTAPPLQLNPKPARGYQVVFNQPSWHATGVINDIPNSAQVSQLRLPPTSLDLASRSTSTSNPETVRALELALREVLDSVKAAAFVPIPHFRDDTVFCCPMLTPSHSARVQPQSSPFDFDLQSQTFPALCLQALPPPPSLFSTHQFPTPTSFPLNPPSFEQRDVVHQALLAKIHQWRTDQLAASAAAEKQRESDGDHLPRHSPIDPETIERAARQHEDMLVRHLESSSNYWMSLSAEARRETWQLEITRAFAKEAEKRKRIEEQLARTQQEANYLRAQVEKLASCQWPREFAIFPPNMLPLAPDVARELDTKDSKMNTAESSRWDYDMLVARWRRVVMHDKSMGRVGQLPELSFDPASSNRPGSGLGRHTSSYLSLPSLKGTSPPQRHAYPPGSPSGRHHSSSFHGREPGDSNDSSRPAKRARTQHPEHSNYSSYSAEGPSDHGHQQPQRLPSLSSASTPISAPSPFAQPPPNPSNPNPSSNTNTVHYPYNSTASTPSTAAPVGEPAHHAYHMSSTPSDRHTDHRPSYANGEETSAQNSRRYGFGGGGDNSPHTELAHPNGTSNRSGNSGGYGEKIPSLHLMAPRVGEHGVPPR